MGASGYRVVVADPPWEFVDALTMSKVKRGAGAHYASLSTSQLCALGPLLEPLLDDDAVLVLWRPSSLAEDGLRVMKAWGFRQTQEIVWYKAHPRLRTVAFGMGRLFRAAKEVAFVGVRGSPYGAVRYKSVRDVFLAEAGEHSEKPESAQDALERMFPTGPYLEMFARRDRPRWDCLGLEAPATRGIGMATSLLQLADGRAS